MIDMRTVIFSYIISNAICAIVIASLWLQNRRRFAGLGFWLADFVMQFTALLLSALRGILPDFVSMTVSNTLVIGGTMLLLAGLERFIGKRGKHIHNIILLVVFILVHTWFTIVHPSLEARNINLSLGLLAVCSHGAWLMLHRADAEIRPITRGVGMIFGAYCLVSLVRVFVDLAVPASEDFFHSNTYDTSLVMMYQMLFIALTFSLFLMVNRRLFANLEGDIIERKRTEEALRISEEKFFKAFQASPDAITISRMSDGRLVDVNEGFSRLTEYSREESLSSSSVNLGIWADPQDREKCVAALRANQHVREQEYNFRTKSGKILNGLYSGELILLGNEAHILSVVRDITERKRYEDVLQKQTIALTERVKELNCIGELAHLIEIPGISLDEILRRSINLLRAAMQYPGFAGVKLVIGEQTYTTENYQASTRKLSEDIMDGGRTIGTLEVCYPQEMQQEQEHLFWEEEKSLLHIITERLGHVFKRIQTDEALRHQNEILAALHLVILDLVSRLDVDDILQTLLRKTGSLLNAPHVSVDLVEGNDLLVTYAATPGQPLQKGDAMRRGEGGWLSWQVIETGRPAILEDYSTWSKRRSLYDDFPIHAIMVIPISLRERVIGAINIFRSEAKKPFNDTDTYVAGQLAQMVALVLDNAQLYTQMQSELTERKLAEEATNQSEKLLRAIAENYPHSYLSVINRDLTVGFTSGQEFKKQNLDPNQFVGLKLEQVFDDQTGIVKEHYLKTFEGNETSFELSLDGQHQLYKAVPLFAQDGSIPRILSVVENITERKQAEEASLKLASFEERQRLARDLHDSVSQSIHSLVLFSETLSSIIEKNRPERVKQIAERLQESARQALKETRLMLYELQPSAPGRSVDLIQDLEIRLATVERRAGVRAQIIQEGSMENCPAEWYENLFWITIEALNNAIKHAQARKVQITIRCSPRHLELEVLDNGKGFDPNKSHAGGLGLRNMRERAGIIGGEITIISSPNQGSSVRFNADIEAKP